MSARRVKGLRRATARRAAPDAVAASWTMGAEKMASSLYPACVPCERLLICGRSACVARRAPGGPPEGQSPALTPGRGAAGAALI